MKVKKKRTYSLATKRLISKSNELYSSLCDLNSPLLELRLDESRNNRHLKKDGLTEHRWNAVTGQIQGLLELQRQIHEVAWFLRDKIYEYPELLLEGREEATDIETEDACELDPQACPGPAACGRKGPGGQSCPEC